MKHSMSPKGHAQTTQLFLLEFSVESWKCAFPWCSDMAKRRPHVSRGLGTLERLLLTYLIEVVGVVVPFFAVVVFFLRIHSIDNV